MSKVDRCELFGPDEAVESIWHGCSHRAWIIWSFASEPAIFTQVLTIGLSNGALYALIALGYTMVYGIIELINFAHGDLFMLGSVIGAIFLEQWLNQKSSSASAWAMLGRHACSSRWQPVHSSTW